MYSSSAGSSVKFSSKQLRRELDQAEKNENAAPWERVSATFSITDYDRKNDKTVKEVLERATQMMTNEKKKMKL